MIQPPLKPYKPKINKKYTSVSNLHSLLPKPMHKKQFKTHRKLHNNRKNQDLHLHANKLPAPIPTIQTLNQQIQTNNDQISINRGKKKTTTTIVSLYYPIRQQRRHREQDPNNNNNRTRQK